MQPTTLAWRFNAAAKPLMLASQSRPHPGPEEVLVANSAAGINPVDWKFISLNPRNWPQGHIPGVDGAGVIQAVGIGVSEQLIGQRVAYHTSLLSQGSFAHYTLLKAGRFMLLPAAVSDAVAAALPCPLLTAIQAADKLPGNEGTVLLAGMGAVNKLVAQLLTRRGFRVFAISASLPESEARLLGISQLYRDKAQVGQSFFAVIDATGTENARALVPLLKANGHIVSILGRIEVPVDAPFTRTISYHEVALGALHEYGDSDAWQQLMQKGEYWLTELSQGRLTVASPTSFSFSQLPDALTYSAAQSGKAVIELAKPSA